MKYAIAIVVVALIAIAIAKNIRIVPQSFAYVIERLGVYSTTWQTGLHIKIPFIERVAKKISLKEQDASGIPFLYARDAAVLNDISEESTG